MIERNQDFMMEIMESSVVDWGKSVMVQIREHPEIQYRMVSKLCFW